jgi:hypothetical protein
MYEWEINTQELNNLSLILSYCKENKYTYQVHGSFGDVYIQIACIYEKIKKENEKYNIIIEEKYAKLVKKLEKKGCKILLINGGGINNLFNKYQILGNKTNLPIRLLPTIYPMIPDLISEGLLDYNEFLRKLIGLSPSTKYINLEEDEEFEEAKEYLRKNNISFNNTVLLSLDNNTHHELIEEDVLKIIKILERNKWEILINDSGNLTSNETKYKKIIEKFNKIKVPAHLCVSIVKLCGFYIGGSNGFTTLQGLFNTTPGIHIVGNGINYKHDLVIDKFDNNYKLNAIMLSSCAKKHFQNNHQEIVYTNNGIEDVLNKIDENLKKIKRNME